MLAFLGRRNREYRRSRRDHPSAKAACDAVPTSIARRNEGSGKSKEAHRERQPVRSVHLHESGRPASLAEAARLVRTIQEARHSESGLGHEATPESPSYLSRNYLDIDFFLERLAELDYEATPYKSGCLCRRGDEEVYLVPISARQAPGGIKARTFERIRQEALACGSTLTVVLTDLDPQKCDISALPSHSEGSASTHGAGVVDVDIVLVASDTLPSFARFLGL